MRVLHVLAEKGFSGGENQLRATLLHMKDLGVESTIAMNPDAGFRKHAEALKIPVIEVKIRNNFDLLAAWQLRRLYGKFKPDLVHLACSRSHKVGSLAGVLNSSLAPKVVTRRMDYPLRADAYRRWLYGKAVRAVVAISLGVQEAILKIGIDPAMVHLINEGVDTQRLGQLRKESRAAARKKLGLGNDDFFAVTTASLHHRKGHDLILAAMARLQLAKGRRLVWLFGGEGPEKAKLQQLAEQLPDHCEVRIPGQIDYVEDALAAADLFCLPSRFEGLGVALLEALATGAPCIAAYVGGMREVLVTGESGWHFPVEDVDALTAAVQWVLDHPQEAETIGSAGKARAAEKFDARLMARRTTELYRQVVAAAVTP